MTKMTTVARGVKVKRGVEEKMRSKKGSSKAKVPKKKASKGRAKFKKVMHEFKEGKLHSNSKMGPLVTNPKQAVAISYREAENTHKRKKKK